MRDRKTEVHLTYRCDLSCPGCMCTLRCVHDSCTCDTSVGYLA